MSQPLTPQTRTESDRKQCIACREEIDAGAMKCPHCQAWQSKWQGPAGQRRLMLLIMLPSFLAVFVGQYVLLSRYLSREREDFEPHRAEVTLVDTKMDFDNSSVVILGGIKNSSKIEWEKPQLEARFRDAQGNLIDTISQELYFVKIPPGETVSFKLDTTRAVEDKAEYHRFDIRIVTAQAAERR